MKDLTAEIMAELDKKFVFVGWGFNFGKINDKGTMVPGHKEDLEHFLKKSLLKVGEGMAIKTQPLNPNRDLSNSYAIERARRKIAVYEGYVGAADETQQKLSELRKALE